jgi:hypothetical protein
MARTTSLALVISSLVLGLFAGCEGEKRYLPNEKNATTTSAPPAPPPIQPRPIIGQKTDVIKDATRELQQGGAQQSSGRIIARDPITLSGNAYVSAIGQTSVQQIQHTLDLYHAEHDKYPATLEEFMNEIIKPNGIRLPQLPYYQEYAYDAPNHKLVVLEYPDRKEQMQRQQDESLGRTPR